MLFESKQAKVQAGIEQYCRTVLQCVEAFREAVLEHCDAPDHARIKERFAAVHRLESQADDIRREIEVLLYAKALFPESRGDILGLLEAMDKVPNRAEACVRKIYEENLAVPEEFESRVEELLDICCRCVGAMIEAVRKLFSDHVSAMAAVGKIDELETEADRIESGLKEAVFAADLDGVQKILLRDLIGVIADLCDRAETVGDRIGITVAKRGI